MNLIKTPSSNSCNLFQRERSEAERTKKPTKNSRAAGKLPVPILAIFSSVSVAKRSVPKNQQKTQGLLLNSMFASLLIFSSVSVAKRSVPKNSRAAAKLPLPILVIFSSVSVAKRSVSKNQKKHKGCCC